MKERGTEGEAHPFSWIVLEAMKDFIKSFFFVFVEKLKIAQKIKNVRNPHTAGNIVIVQQARRGPRHFPREPL